ncbi:Trp biosynthesis-associated membrane protein [Microbacterium sp. LRZ72]|uniref:Trp biosynthesis-associated membrane protein n=1 Tax=Microbacterium sp. LRZ72 TaxID=2942481 RepID=UPI0029A52C59|nr:Trp biosynthesis-associated membrane protein [Microbacterium sp. LRZ72]MDX2375405.1 Trp biosynthesis-associated membrane protein [Microbacterium sp. LRZ72]
MRRARLTAVLTTLGASALVLIASTQTWFTVVLVDESGRTLSVVGADAVPVLAPLALAGLALGAAMTLAGRLLGVILTLGAVLLGAVLLVLIAPLVAGDTLAAVAPAVTEATGIAGDDAVAQLLDVVRVTAWPVLAGVFALLILAAGIFGAITATSWRTGGRRYRTDAPRPASAPEQAPERLDAVDSWDDLSRGDDPTR